MKRISIQALKSQLSSAIAEAQSGATIIVTRHNQPVAQLGPARTAHLHRGTGPNETRLKPAIKHASKGRYLTVLAEDRAGR
jgi:antitoxin (DNA-binding transcriptional repressor) of toxin-antitoxin stability system